MKYSMAETGRTMITSAVNAKVKNIIKLQKKSRERRRQDCFVAEGIKMFLEAPPELIREVYLSKSLYENRMAMDRLSEQLGLLDAAAATDRPARMHLSAAAGQAEISGTRTTIIEIVEDSVFAQMSDTKTPQGILCVLSMLHYDLEERLEGAQGTWVLLEDLQDPGNLGTILRTAEGAGVEGVILTENTVDIYNPKTIRSTMGSLYRVPFFVTADTTGTIRHMKELGFAVYAAHLGGTKPYDAYRYTGRCAFLIGNEGNGLSGETAALATDYLRIPMEGSVESLNASVAASLLMYEAYRHRRGTGSGNP